MLLDKETIKEISELSTSLKYIQTAVDENKKKLDEIDKKVDYLNVGNVLLKEHLEEAKTRRTRLVAIVGIVAATISTLIAGAVVLVLP
mgnify:CR=1 FL=1|jgi:type IV secretory pathway component VirB8